MKLLKTQEGRCLCLLMLVALLIIQGCGKGTYRTKEMYVPGYGWGEVHDVGSAIKGDHIDLFFPSEQEAKKWGKNI